MSLPASATRSRRQHTPWFSYEQQGLDDLWRLYRRDFDEIWAHLVAVSRSDDEMGAMLSDLPEEVLVAQRETSRASIARGVAGCWDDYVAYLRSQAQSYAARGVSFSCWYHLGRVLYDELAARVVRDLGGQPERLEAALRATRNFISSGIAMLGTEYLAAKEEALWASERSLVTTLNSIGEAVIATDPGRRITRMNHAAERLSGWSAAEACGRPLEEVVPLVQKVKDGFVSCLPASTFPEDQVVQFPDDSMMLVGRTGSACRVAGTVAPIRNDDLLVTGMVMVLRDTTEASRARAELQASGKQLRALAARLQKVCEEERTRLARELHDELSQQLTALQMDIAWMLQRAAADRDPGMLNERLGAMSTLVDSMAETVRQVSAELRPGVLDHLGLTHAVAWQAREFQKRSGIEVTVHARAEDLDVSDEQATALFRCFQEILTNVARHAHATQIYVWLKESPDVVELRVTDNGRGVSPQEAADPMALGLLGMRERSTLLGGSFVIEGVPGEGTTVTIRLPRPLLGTEGCRS